MLQWLDQQRRPPWEEVAVLSLVTKGLWAKFEALRLWDGVLQRAWKEPATGEVRWQVVVPHSLRGEVLQAVHGAVGSGHFGVTKILRRLRLGFYWGQHKRDVEDFCRRCDGCTARKGPAERSHWNILLINQCEGRITRSVGGGAWENRRVGACTLKGPGWGLPG